MPTARCLPRFSSWSLSDGSAGVAAGGGGPAGVRGRVARRRLGGLGGGRLGRARGGGRRARGLLLRRVAPAAPRYRQRHGDAGQRRSSQTAETSSSSATRKEEPQ